MKDKMKKQMTMFSTLDRRNGARRKGSKEERVRSLADFASISLRI